ncbi:hypothetical protein MTR67_026012 [Solanum verrucosum]|uniref:Integrase zinc-binding domain-containing protein n=1 Tax=Solanum verrucosum TaxID=315347 RepID=A0AAF0R242_SOLVR|nr:hypothetical protein MTR67_026012 [Solanum verrucosum]
MNKAHCSRYSIHLGSTKMYHDLKEVYWWNDMKRNIVEYVAKCSNCQQVKVEHKRPDGLTQTMDIPIWKWEDINMDFITGNWDDHMPLLEFAYNNSYHSSIDMAPFKALYGRRCRSPIGWFEVGETQILGPDLVHQAIEKVKLIKERLKIAQSRQKSYADVCHRDIEFQVDDWVFLKVSPMKGVMRFGRKGKLCPRYIGPYKVIRRVVQVAYKMDLPRELTAVHPVFHVSMLCKCLGDPTQVIPIEGMEFSEHLSYEEVPVAILDRQVRKLRTKDIALVKVLDKDITDSSKLKHLQYKVPRGSPRAVVMSTSCGPTRGLEAVARHHVPLALNPKEISRGAPRAMELATTRGPFRGP